MNSNTNDYHNMENRNPAQSIAALKMEEPRKINMHAYDASFTVQITFNHPAAEVWPHILNFKSWMTDYHFDMTSGEEHNEGAIIKATAINCSDDVPKAHHKFVRIVRIVPKKVLVLKVFSAEGGSLGDKDYVVFDTFNLVEHNGKTTVVINCSGEFPKKAITNKEQQITMDTNIQKVMGDMFDRYEVTLKKLVAKSNKSEIPIRL